MTCIQREMSFPLSPSSSGTTFVTGTSGAYVTGSYPQTVSYVNPTYHAAAYSAPVSHHAVYAAPPVYQPVQQVVLDFPLLQISALELIVF